MVIGYIEGPRSNSNCSSIDVGGGEWFSARGKNLIPGSPLYTKFPDKISTYIYLFNQRNMITFFFFHFFFTRDY